MKTNLKILHIDTGKGWRGGQQQAIYLHEELISKGIGTALVCQPGSELERYCEIKQLPYYPIRMRNELDFISGFKIARLCKKKQYNILHLHTAHALAIGLWAKMFHPKLKLIAVRRVDFHIKKNWFSQFKYNSALTDKIVCISNAIKQVLLSDGIPEDKLITIHSGVDLHKFDSVEPDKKLKRNLGIEADHIIVGTVAAIVGHKDYPTLLRAAERVIQETDNVTFCAVGDGDKKKEVHKLAQNLDLKNRFKFLGYRKDIGALLKSFDIFVLASNEEGFGTSLLDAQAVGLPVIGTKAGGIPEAIQHEHNGFLVPIANDKLLADTILELVNNPEKRTQFGSAGKQFVRQFSIEKTCEKNIELYEKIINS